MVELKIEIIRLFKEENANFKKGISRVFIKPQAILETP